MLPPALKKMYRTEPPWFVGVREVWDEVADPNNWRDGEYHGFADKKPQIVYMGYDIIINSP